MNAPQGLLITAKHGNKKPKPKKPKPLAAAHRDFEGLLWFRKRPEGLGGPASFLARAPAAPGGRTRTGRRKR